MMPATTHRALLSALTVALVVVLVSAFTEDLCAKYGEMVVIPGIDGTDFCKTAQLMDQNMEKCLLLDMAGLAFTRDKMGITLSNTVGALACKAAQQTPIPVNRVDGTPISHTLPDLRPLPVTFPSSVLAAEGATYHFWWSQVLNFGTASSCAATRTPHTLTEGMLQLEAPGQWNLAPGWSIHSAVWSNANMGSSLAGVYLPLAAVMHKGDVLAVVIRGTETFSDWEADFTYSQVSFAGGPISWPGRTHEGFSKLAAHLWLTGVQAAVDALVLPQGSSIQHLVVTGHSMGAGVSTLLSYAIQAYLDKAKSSVRVDAMLFAPPNIGDQVFAKAFGAMVNGRRIPFKSDIVSQLPCTPTVTACVRGPWAGAPLIATGVWAYHTIPGTVALTPGGMPMEAEAWSSFKNMHACQLGRYVVATHLCAYQCYLSQFVQGGAARNMCRLRASAASGAGAVDGGQQVGSFCLGFPVSSGAQYPYEHASPVDELVEKVASLFV